MKILLRPTCLSLTRSIAEYWLQRVHRFVTYLVDSNIKQLRACNGSEFFIYRSISNW